MLICGGERKQILNSYNGLLLKCNKSIETLNEFQFSAVKPRWLDNLDRGPGVSATKFEVKFRNAELNLLYERDYGCRIHSPRGSFGDNEAERTNGAVGDSIVDGTTFQWEKYPRFHNFTDDDIARLTVK